MKHKINLTLLTLLISIIGKAQAVLPPEPLMAEGFRSEGKIYVVIAVLAIIFICIIVYLIAIDSKIKRLEKNNL